MEGKERGGWEMKREGDGKYMHNASEYRTGEQGKNQDDSRCYR